MAVSAWLWIVLTLAAAATQTLRNAAQRSLTETLGSAGATHVRFLFGLPFGLAGVGVVAALGYDLPKPSVAWLTWTAAGGVAQVLATAMMLLAMRERSFVVTTAYMKTEPVQTAVFAVVLLHEPLSLNSATAILIATAGVLMMSWPARGAAFNLRSTLLGVAAGGCFGLAAVCFAGGIDALGAPDFLPAAIVTVALALTLQAAMLSLWLTARQPGVLGAVVRAWRPSLAAGFLGAVASQLWFAAMAIENPARVRALGLVELLFAGLLSGRYFREAVSLRETLGIAVMLAGLVLLIA